MMNSAMNSILRPLCSKSAAKARLAVASNSRSIPAMQSPWTNKTTLRAFSTDCEPAEKLRNVFEEYRQTHFSRELPSRFKKEVVKVIEGPDNKVALDNFNILLQNIGRSDAYLSEAEIDELIEAVGSTDRRIPTKEAMQLLM